MVVMMIFGISAAIVVFSVVVGICVYKIDSYFGIKNNDYVAISEFILPTSLICANNVLN